MKHLVYSIVKGIEVVYSTTNAEEAISKLEETKPSKIAVDHIDLDELATTVWNRLSTLEKLALERVDCILWRQPAQSKDSI